MSPPQASLLARRWQELGVRRRVHLVFLAGGLLLAVAVGLVVWVLARGYLLDLRQSAAVRQAHTSAATVERLLTPETR